MKKILLMLILILSLSSNKSSAMLGQNSAAKEILKSALLAAGAVAIIAIAVPIKNTMFLVETYSEGSYSPTNPTHRTGINNRKSCNIQ